MKTGLAPVPSAPIPSAARRREIALAGAAIAVAGIAAYANSFSAPFVLDDLLAIVTNPSIRHFGSALQPPLDAATATGRPVLNVSLAVNYASGGVGVRGYHAVNLLIHVCAGLALFGIVRRTLALRRTDATFVAFVAALLWTVHPLQTESVTYVVQRAESLMGLFYLLTLYGFVRGAKYSEVRNQRSEVSGLPPAAIRPLGSGLWLPVSVLSCLLGMGTKEVMVSAPVMVLLYDRTFVSGSFRESWRRHRSYYAALAATWLPLAWLVAASHGRNNTAGFGVAVSWWQYALTQFPAIVRYLELAAWPHPLVFDYGAQWVDNAWSVLPQAALVIALGIGSVVALWRRPVWGFFGFWFFSILAPTSIMPGLRQTMAEQRMYLALAPVMVGSALLLAQLGARGRWAGIGLALALAWLTARRNENYRSNLSLWADTVAKVPDNAFAQHNFGLALFEQDRPREAEEHYRTALRLNPNLPETHNNLGVVLTTDKRLPEAIAEYEEALRLKPGYADAHNNLGFALAAVGQWTGAIAQFTEALRLKPGYAEAENGLGSALAGAGQTEEAVAHYERALQLKPGYAEAHNNLGSAFMKLGRLDQAGREFEAILQNAPDNLQARENLGTVFVRLRRPDEAVSQYEYALRLDPDNAETHSDLAIALIQSGRRAEALPHFQEAVRLAPGRAIFHANLGNALAESGHTAEAVAEYEAALQIDPNLVQVRVRLDRLRAQPPDAKP